ncbi:glycoside hydrolase family 3 N-terminal domain-containing protein [uncultured Desulfobulbus sp.]|uniref:glycoside hydrolase family 3 protein n=1 Tax=uncultured Desulfobulbus sp. TaxID=239745 RepID=UPI0029C8C24A|nr:glycoside hydrolase family 3 N-terminal domain-containing protein [uncultured Desulfobulbus sp.]
MRVVSIDDLTLDEKIGQMIVVSNWESVEYCITELKCGGVWPAGTPKDNAEVFRADIARMQALADIPLFISTDFENGAGQCITDGSCTEFPSMMAYGAISDIDEAVRLAYESGRITAMEADYIGVNITPSPVFDVNTVPENPISNTRSISDDPEKVWRIAGAYSRGMMTGRLLPQAKHFPGEGMHRFDPHLRLERMQVTEQEMEDIHLLPFRKAVEMGIPMMMTNHAIYTCFDEVYPCTLSKKLITGILRNKMDFEGLLITDAMEMHGITSGFGAEEALILAVDAGNDLILEPSNKKFAIEWVHKAIESGRIQMEVIDRAVTRILKYKEQLGLYKSPNPSDTKPQMLLDERHKVALEVAGKSITLIRDTQSLIPITPCDDMRVLLLEPANPNHPGFDWGLKYNMTSICDSLKEVFVNAEIKHFSSSSNSLETDEILSLAKNADIVFISTSFKSLAGQVGLLNADQVSLIQAVVAANERTVFVVSNPYVTAELPFAKTIIANYGPFKVSVEATRDVILGRMQPIGVLPVCLPDSIDPNNVETIAHD